MAALQEFSKQDSIRQYTQGISNIQDSCFFGALNLHRIKIV